MHRCIRKCRVVDSDKYLSMCKMSCAFTNPEPILTSLIKYFQFMPGSCADPEFCLGAKLKRTKLANGIKARHMAKQVCAEKLLGTWNRS